MDRSVIALIFGCCVAAGTLISMTAQPDEGSRVLSHAPDVSAAQGSVQTDGVALTSRLRMGRSQDHRGATIRTGPGNSKFIRVDGRH